MSMNSSLKNQHLILYVMLTFSARFFYSPGLISLFYSSSQTPAICLRGGKGNNLFLSAKIFSEYFQLSLAYLLEHTPKYISLKSN